MPPKGSKKAEKSESKPVAKAEKSDKPKAKRTASPYIIFCQEKRTEVKKTHPNASFGETGKILGQMWAALDEKAKAVSVLHA